MTDTTVVGMSLAAFTLLHVIISLIAIAAGFIVLYQMFGSKVPRGWTALFLGLTALTCLTGYLFPFDKVLPSHIVGAITLVVLAVAGIALYRYRLAGSWRWVYVGSAVLALYLNTFVGVVQSFLKVSFLHALAPTQGAPAFIVAQAIVMLLFVGAGILASRAFHPETAAEAIRALKPQGG